MWWMTDVSRILNVSTRSADGRRSSCGDLLRINDWPCAPVETDAQYKILIRHTAATDPEPGNIVDGPVKLSKPKVQLFADIVYLYKYVYVNVTMYNKMIFKYVFILSMKYLI